MTIRCLATIVATAVGIVFLWHLRQLSPFELSVSTCALTLAHSDSLVARSCSCNVSREKSKKTTSIFVSFADSRKAFLRIHSMEDSWSLYRLPFIADQEITQVVDRFQRRCALHLLSRPHTVECAFNEWVGRGNQNEIVEKHCSALAGVFFDSLILTEPLVLDVLYGYQKS